MESLGIRQNEPNRVVSSLRVTLDEKAFMVREVGALADVTEDPRRMADSVGELPIDEDGWPGEIHRRPPWRQTRSGITF